VSGEQSVFTQENLSKTYGGKLTLLDRVSQVMADPASVRKR